MSRLSKPFRETVEERAARDPEFKKELEKEILHMPTNNEEAIKICRIINEFVDVSTAKKITTKLYEEVGKTTENESLSVSLEMLKLLYDHYTGD